MLRNAKMKTLDGWKPSRGGEFESRHKSSVPPL